MDIENYTNRSPYPMLHLLREASVERAVAAVGDSGGDLPPQYPHSARLWGTPAGGRMLWQSTSPDLRIGNEFDRLAGPDIEAAPCGCADVTARRVQFDAGQRRHEFDLREIRARVPGFSQ